MAEQYIVGYNDFGNPIFSDNINDIPGYSGNSAKYGTTHGGLSFLNGNDDSTLNAVNQQALWDREDNLRKVAELREDTSMDRIVAAAKRNGINPIFLLDALSGQTVGNAASYTTSAAKANNYDTNARTDQATSAKMFGALLAAFAMIAIKALA